MYANFTEHVVVGGGEGVQVAGAVLDGAVPSQQFTPEAHADLLDAIARREHQRGEEVVLGVAAMLEDRDLEASSGSPVETIYWYYLRTRDDDGLPQALEHEGQGRGCVGHGVSPVEYHEAVVEVVVALKTKHVGGEMDVKLSDVFLQLRPCPL